MEPCGTVGSLVPLFLLGMGRFRYGARRRRATILYFVPLVRVTPPSTCIARGSNAFLGEDKERPSETIAGVDRAVKEGNWPRRLEIHFISRSLAAFPDLASVLEPVAPLKKGLIYRRIALIPCSSETAEFPYIFACNVEHILGSRSLIYLFYNRVV